MNRVSFPARVFGCTVLVLALTSLASADILINRVDKVFAQWDKPGSPGCALGVIKDGALIYKRGYGMASLEHNIPISSTSVFRIGSTSKQFSALSILLLVEEGKLSLDDDIRKYLPEMPDYGSPVTIRHLIHHSSGIRDYLTLMSLAGKSDDDFYTDEDVVVMLARQRELNFNPGDRFLYSNSGYFLLSQIVKRASGQSLREYAAEKIFGPLGMQNTHLHDDHTLIVQNRAAGYSPRKDGGYQINMTTLGMVGDGGVFTTVEDLLQWDRNFYHNRLGGENLIEKMLTPGVLNNGEEQDYAFGLRGSSYEGLRMVSHGGAFVGFRAEMIRFPAEQFSVICLCNRSDANPSRLARRVADIYLADQMVLEEKSASGEERTFVQLDDQVLRALTGAFRNPETGSVWKLAAEEGALRADTGSFRFRLRPLSENHFRAVDAPVEMEVGFEGSRREGSLVLRVEAAGQEPAAYEAVELASPTLAELRAYAGEYYSDELQVTYKLVLEEGRLFFRHRNAPESALEPTLSNQFRVRGLNIEFVHDKGNAASGFVINTGRVKNIRFGRKKKSG